MAKTAQSRKISRAPNLFGWSKKEKAKRKIHASAATEARGAGYRLGLEKSDEHFSEWLERKEFGDESAKVKERLGAAFADGFNRGKKELEAKAARERAKEEKEAARERLKEKSSRDRKYKVKRFKVIRYKGATIRKVEGGFESSIDKGTKFESIGEAKRFIDSQKKNPKSCPVTRKQKVSDRAKRYRANQPACQPSGPRRCELCGNTSGLMVDHVDGNESHGLKSNLRWLCRSCNTKLGAAMAKAGQGRRTVQYNPGGAKTLHEYIQAVLAHTRGSHDAAGKIIHATPKGKRREYAAEIWGSRSARRRAEGDVPDWVNPTVSGPQYRLAQAVIAGTARDTHMPVEVAEEIVKATPAKKRREWSKGNPDFRLWSRSKQHTRHVETKEHQAGYALGIKDRRAGRDPRSDYAADLTKGSLRSEFNKHGFPNRVGVGIENSFIIFRQGYNRGLKQMVGPRGRLPNPYAEAAELSETFHGRPATQVERIEEKVHRHSKLSKLGDMVRMVIDTPTGEVVRLNFDTKTPERIVRLATSEDKDPKTGKVIGKQLYLVGGDQEVNLKALHMDGPEWVRDRMELGRLHEFPDDVEDGSIVYRTRKKFNNFKLTDWWHKAGEETSKKAGPAARPLVIYDRRNKRIELAGGQYRIDAPGIIN